MEKTLDEGTSYKYTISITCVKGRGVSIFLSYKSKMTKFEKLVCSEFAKR